MTGYVCVGHLSLLYTYFNHYQALEYVHFFYNVENHTKE